MVITYFGLQITPDKRRIKMHGCHCNAPLEATVCSVTGKTLYFCTNCGCECYPYFVIKIEEEEDED